jgi:hypothetical protein
MSQPCPFSKISEKLLENTNPADILASCLKKIPLNAKALIIRQKWMKPSSALRPRDAKHQVGFVGTQSCHVAAFAGQLDRFVLP